MCSILFHFEATIKVKVHYLEGRHLAHDYYYYFLSRAIELRYVLSLSYLPRPLFWDRTWLSCWGWAGTWNPPASASQSSWDYRHLHLTYWLLLYDGSFQGGEQHSSVAFKGSDPGAQASWVPVPVPPFPSASPWAICFVSHSLIVSISRVCRRHGGCLPHSANAHNVKVTIYAGLTLPHENDGWIATSFITWSLKEKCSWLKDSENPKCL